jgi:hypothetical protein
MLINEEELLISPPKKHPALIMINVLSLRHGRSMSHADLDMCVRTPKTLNTIGGMLSHNFLR